MRDLTPEELALAPEWATHYAVLNGGYIGFYDWYKRQLLNPEKILSRRLTKSIIPNYAKPIAKSFDITQYEWSDDNLSLRCIDFEGDINLWCKDVDDELFINRKDAVAIAKHFKLTAEDLG